MISINTKGVPLVFILVYCLVAFCQESQAQSNYRQGKIVFLNGDVKSGLIDHKKESINPKEVRWKEKEDSEPIKLGLDKLKSFEVEGIRFQSVDLDQIKLHNIAISDENPTRHAFMQVIVEGKVSLFSQMITPRTRMFFLKNDSIIIRLLDFHKEYNLENFSTVRKLGSSGSGTKRYKHILKTLLAGCDESIDNRIDELKGNEKGLKKIVIDYNHCIGEDDQFISPRTQGFLNFGIQIAHTETKFEVYNLVQSVYLDFMNFPSSKDFSYGFFIDAHISEKWSINNQFLLSKFSTQDDAALETGFFNTKLEATSFSFQSSIRRSIPVVGDLNGYFQVGPPL
ncbi:MAG: hypothetical protein JXR03_11970 [Cyclobacteriaceae bacterium]